MVRLRAQELSALSEALLELYLPIGTQDLPERLFGVLRRFIAGDVYSYNEHVGCHNERLTTAPAYLDEVKMQVFNRYLYQHPSLQAAMATGTQAPVKISDFATIDDWRRTDLYDAIFRSDRQDYQLAYIDVHVMPNLAISLSRSRRDFSEEERAMLNLLRPHLLQAYRMSKLLTHFSEASEAAGRAYLVADADFRIRFATRQALDWLQEYFDPAPAGGLPRKLQDWLTSLRASLLRPGTAPSVPAELWIQHGPKRLMAHSLSPLHPDEQRLFLSESVQAHDALRLQSLGLTRREAEVLLWVAQGKSNADVARILDMQERTACKHMENILAKLYVENRTAAAQRALEVLH